MSDFGDPEVGAFLTFLDLAREKDRDKPARHHSLLVHLRARIDVRIRDAEIAVARARSKTPSPRRPSGAFTTQHSRAQTAPHNIGELVAQAEAELEIGERQTPVCDPPSIHRPVVEGEIRNVHPDRER